MTLLFWMELINYMSPNVTEELFVDTSRNPHIQINLDIVVPSISCDFLSLDAMDSSGEQHLQIDHNIYKRRLDLEGRPIEEPKRKILLYPVKNHRRVKIKLSVAVAMELQSTLKGVVTLVRMYVKHIEKGGGLFPDNPENISQCKDEHFNEKLTTAFSQGCQIYGSLVVNRVSGSFHIAPGRSFSVNHVHVHDVQPFSSASFNTSHRIRHITFGTNIDSESHNPLKNTIATATEGATMFQYHIKLVPTMYVRMDGTIITSSQYSVTKHQKVISIMSGESGMPGAFFQYELSPLMVKRTERSRSFGHFATNVCAIIGGVYTVAGLIDSMLYNSIKFMQKN